MFLFYRIKLLFMMPSSESDESDTEIEEIKSSIRKSDISKEFKSTIEQCFDNQLKTKRKLKELRDYVSNKGELTIIEEKPETSEAITQTDHSNKDVSTQTRDLSIRELPLASPGQVSERIDYFSNISSPIRQSNSRINFVSTGQELIPFTQTSTPLFGPIQLSITTYLSTALTSEPLFTSPFYQPSYISSLFPNQPLLHSPSGNQGRNIRSITSGSTNMSTLTATDISNITNIIQSNQNSNDNRLKQFNGSPSEAVQWIEEFEYYAGANGWDDNKRRSKLGTYLTGPSREWFTLEVNNTNLNWDDVKTLFFTQFLPVDYEQHMKRELRNRKQKLYEASANYICAMRAILKRSNQQMSEAEAVDHIIHGMLPQIAKKLIILNPKTYTDLRKQANLIEQSLKTVQESTDGQLLQLTETLSQLNVKSTDNKPKQRRLNYNNASNFNSRTSRGTPRCYRCNKLGHVQVNCRSQQFNRNYNNRQQNFGRGRGNWYSSRGRGFNYRNRNNGYGNRNFQQNRNRNNNFQNNNARLVQSTAGEPEQTVHVLNIIGEPSNGFNINVSINGNTIHAILDTGASSCFMSKRYANSNDLAITEWKGKGYKMANGVMVYPFGETKITISITLNGITRSAELSIYVIKGLNSDIILGYNLIRSMGIVINGRENTVSF